MNENIIIATVVGAVRGLAAGALNKCINNATNEPLIGSSRQKSISRDFTSFDYSDDINFDFTDTVFNEFTEIICDSAENVEVDISDGQEWRESRPHRKDWIIICIKVSFYLTVVSSLIGIIGCVIMFIDINTTDVCIWLGVYNIPKPIQQIKVLCQTIEAQLAIYAHIITILLTFGFKLVHKLNLIYWNMLAAFFDSLYRLVLYIFGLYDEMWQIYPLHIVFILVIVINSYKIANYFFQRRRDKFILVAQIGLQQLLAVETGFLTFTYLAPWFVNLSVRNQLIVASAGPILGTIAKVTSRLSVQSMKKVTHPGNLYILSILAYIGPAIIARTFQANLQEIFYFSLLCVLHGAIGVAEKFSVLLRDHFYIWFYKKVLRREHFQSRIGLFNTPRTQRYMADLIICHMTHEHIALLYCNALVQLYPLIWIENARSVEVFKDFLLRCCIATFSEYVFNVVSVYILTWYLNIPIIKLWKIKWRKYVVVNGLAYLIIICLSSNYLAFIVHSKYPSTVRGNATEGACNASSLLFFK